jgi:arylsulfatase A-like enzyme
VQRGHRCRLGQTHREFGLEHQTGGQRALRDGAWKYLRVDGVDYLFDLSHDQRERANLAKREPARLAAMRADWEAWNATMPAIPEDATISLGYTTQDMPQR